MFTTNLVNPGLREISQCYYEYAASIWVLHIHNNILTYKEEGMLTTIHFSLLAILSKWTPP